MKVFRAAILVLVAASQSACAQPFRLGAPISNFSVRDSKGHPVDYRTSKSEVTVVMFFSTRCPISNAFNYRRNMIYKDFKSRAKFIVVDSNSNESLEEIKAYAGEVEFDFPVYKDVNNEVADRFGVLTTTDSFVIDSSGVMRYHGYVEDAVNSERTTKKGLRLAIEAVLDGKSVATAETKARGCAIRRANLDGHASK